MKKLLLITAMIILGFQSYSQWEPQTIDSNIQLHTIFMMDENLGWISGACYSTQTPYGLIYKTTNGGLSWDSISSPSFNWLDKMYFINPTTGWGRLTWSGNDDGIYKTEDGGVSWNLIFPGENDMCFVSNNEGFILENYANTLSLPASLYSTSDGGETWQFIDSLGGFNSGFFFEPFSIDFLDSNVGYVSYHWSGGGGFHGKGLYITTDGGLTWEEESFPYYAYDLKFTDENTGYACSSGYYGGLYKTINGGDSWELLFDESVYSMFFVTPEKGWISAAWDFAEISYTHDGGITWNIQYIDNGHIFDYFFLDSITGWAIGDNGLILHTTNGGGTYTHINESKTNFESLKVYPNPVSEAVTFELVMEEQGMVVIDVHNSMGKKVSSPISRIYSQGLHKLKWNVTNLDEVIYFCRCKVGSETMTKKIIKIQ